MKMIIAIIGSEDADDLVYELNQHSFFVTKLSTMGGFLKKKSTTLMLGVEDERVEDAISIIKKCPVPASSLYTRRRPWPETAARPLI